MKCQTIICFVCFLVLAGLAHAEESIQRFKPIRFLSASDLDLGPKSNGLDSYAPLLSLLAKCEASLVFGSDENNPALEKAIVKVKGVIVDKARKSFSEIPLYKLELEYNRAFFGNMGFIKGLTVASKKSDTVLHDAQGQDCIKGVQKLE